MSSSRAKDPIRWRDRDADRHALESRAAVLADAASQVQPLTPEAVSRIRSEVLSRRSRRGLRTFLAPLARTRLALAIGLVVVCATTAGGARMLWRKYVSPGRTATPPPAEKLSRQTAHAAPRVAARTADSEPPPAASAESPGEARAEVAPAAERTGFPIGGGTGAKQSQRRLDAAARGGARAPSPGPTEPPASEPPEAAAPVAAPRSKPTEAALVAEALFALRQRDDPRAALATLDRHAREFPHGVLETEALRTRVEAVVQLGELKTALRLLDSKAAGAGADVLGADLLLTRAELRAAVGRFREALLDFTQVLDSASGPLLTGGDERALYGRAVCLGRLAQYARARVDLLAYQKRFPSGRFALEVQRLLAGKDPAPGP